MLVENCKYYNKGRCMAQKNTPTCYYDLDDDCKKYKPDSMGIVLNINAELNWEKICKHIIYTYNLDETEIAQYLTDNIVEFADIKVNE